MARLLVLGVVLAVALVAMASSSRQARSDDDVGLSCGSVFDQLNECLPYITNSANSPTSACCVGVKNVSNQATGKQNLTALCNCIKSELPLLGNTDPSRIASLAHRCGVNRDFPPVDSNYNCAKVPFSV